MKVPSGRLTAAIGSSRSGKTQYVQSQMAGKDRVLVWDIKGEYPAKLRPRTRAELLRIVMSCSGKPGVIAFTPDLLSDFDFFCKAAKAWVKSHYLNGKSSVLIFEETADVTSPGKAPDEYGVILRRYLSYGVDIFAITQRPAESDKTAVGNASIIHLCRLQLARDRKSAANDSGVSLAEIEKLRADQQAGEFDFINIDTGRGFWYSGVLKFVRNKPKFTSTSNEKPL